MAGRVCSKYSYPQDKKRIAVAPSIYAITVMAFMALVTMVIAIIMALCSCYCGPQAAKCCTFYAICFTNAMYRYTFANDQKYYFAI